MFIYINKRDTFVDNNEHYKTEILSGKRKVKKI